MRISFLLLLLFSLPAHATGDRWQTAMDLYNTKQFAQALPMFRAITTGAHTTDAQFQVARCLDELGQPLKAIAAYRTYLRLPDDDATMRPRVQARLSTLVAQTHATLTVHCADADLALTLKHGATTYRLTCTKPARIPAGAATLGVHYQKRPLARRPIQLTAGQATQIQLEGFPRLNISTTLPPSTPAALSINGRPAQALPLWDHLVPPGKYRLVISAPAHQSVAKDSTLMMGQSLTWQADPAPMAQSELPPVPAATHTTAWILAGGATLTAAAAGFFFYQGQQDANESEALRTQYGAASDPAEIVALRKQAGTKIDDANFNNTLGFSSLGLTAVLGGLSVWQFSRQSTSTTTFVPSPSGGFIAWSHPW